MLLGAACGDASTPATPPEEVEVAPPPAPEPVPLVAALEVDWDQRDELPTRARSTLEEQRLRLGLSRVSDVEIQVSCAQKRCTAEVGAQGWP